MSRCSNGPLVVYLAVLGDILLQPGRVEQVGSSESETLQRGEAGAWNDLGFISGLRGEGRAGDVVAEVGDGREESDDSLGVYHVAFL